MKAHLVLTTKYRRNVLTGKMITRLGEVMADICQGWNCELIEFSGEADHVCLLFQHYPQMDLSGFVKNIKSMSSRRIRKEFAEHVNNIYGKDPLWNDSYAITSIREFTVSVRRYGDGL